MTCCGLRPGVGPPLPAEAAALLVQAARYLGDWLTAETAAGRIADDHHHAATHQAADAAATLATALSIMHNLTATLHMTSQDHVK